MKRKSRGGRLSRFTPEFRRDAVALVLDEHRRYLADTPRLDAFEAALQVMVRPGDVVLVTARSLQFARISVDGREGLVPLKDIDVTDWK